MHLDGPDMKTYNVKRIIHEFYYVRAKSKDEAKLIISDPHTITVVKEIIKEER